MTRTRAFIVAASLAACVGFSAERSTAQPAPLEGCVESADSGWASFGLSGRPDWVDVCAERRLRLTPVLPAMRTGIQDRVDRYFGDRGPGVTIGLTLDDGLFYSQGFGWRDAPRLLASGAAAPRTRPDEYTVFRAGSISKVITATALNVLIDNPQALAVGMAPPMALDDPAENYIPELKWVCPRRPLIFDGKLHWLFLQCARGSQVTGLTLRHLAAHTDGLPNYMVNLPAGAQRCWPEPYNESESIWIGDLKKTWVLFAPGEFTAYSGVGSEALGLVLHRATNLPYAEAVRRLVFEPLGMRRSTMEPIRFGTTFPNDPPAVRWRASMYLRRSGPRLKYLSDFTQHQGCIHGDEIPMLQPAGGLSTSIWDFSRFMTVWLSRRAPELQGAPILKASTIDGASTPLFGSELQPQADYCPPGTKDPNDFEYAQCVAANAFGTGWGLIPVWQAGTLRRYLAHNGNSGGLSGGDVVIDQHGRFAAIALTSTDPNPAAHPTHRVPPGFGAFTGDMVMQNVLKLVQQSAATDGLSWSGRPLPSGIARLLWLSGAAPSGGSPAETLAFEQRLLAQFSDQFVFAKGLVAGTGSSGHRNVQEFVKQFFGDAHRCTTFRVRRVDSATSIAVRLLCENRRGGLAGGSDVTLKIDALGRINDMTAASWGVDPY